VRVSFCDFAWEEEGLGGGFEEGWRVERYGMDAGEWSELLKSVVRILFISLKSPKSDEVKGVWRKVENEKGGIGMGMVWGRSLVWITASCVWDENGKRIEGVEKAIWGKELRTTFAERRKLVLGGIEFR
jgi:hypothetical protein